MDSIDRAPHEPGHSARAALYIALLLAFIGLVLAFRLFLAAPPEQRASLAAEGKLAVVWEAWRILETSAGGGEAAPGASDDRGAASGSERTDAERAAARAVRLMALAAQDEPDAFSKRLTSVVRRPPSSVPAGLGDVWRAWRLLRAERPEVPPEELARVAILGLADASQGQGARYMDVDQYEEARAYFEGETYEGIGAWVAATAEGGVFILETFVSGPAEAAGLRRGERILTVDGLSTEGLNEEEVANRVRGPEGTAVELRVQGPEEGSQPRTVVVQRGLVPEPSLQSEIYPQGIGSIWIFRFQRTTGEEFRRTLQSLLDQGIQGLVLDLRRNPGGSLRGATAVASQFLAEGLVMYEVSIAGQREDWPVEPGGIARELPLVVIVNGFSASAAEVVAGALQDAGRAKLYGERTYGKGSVQTFRPLSNGGALYVTIAHWYTPQGRQIQDQGIQPDVQVPAYAEIDAQLLVAYSDLLELIERQSR